MLPIRHVLSLLIVLLTIFSLAPASPLCEPDDEECYDRIMHAGLEDEGKPQQSADQLNPEATSAFWYKQGKRFIRQKLNAVPNTKRAKNMILFLGDGMGLTTLAAARNLVGGEAKSLSFENFPFVGLSKTYSVDQIIADSACTSTAYLGGVKALKGTIGVNGRVERGDCKAVKDPANHVHSIAKWAMDAGKSAGVVTTTRVTHASPSGAYAHTADRGWENDNEVNKACGENSGVPDIAYQLIHGEVGSKLSLVMGGGKSQFIDSKLYERGYRMDGRNLIEEFKKQHPKNVYLETRDELLNAELSSAERVMGVFQDSHLLYHLETNETTNQPTLEEMTRKAVEFLRSDEDGYFIFIEGGRIDHAHHDNMARAALDETVEFSKAIQAARDITSEEDTLIVVTADHSHAFSFAGYANRGSNIFGTALGKPQDKKPYYMLSYANGPSYSKYYDSVTGLRRDPTEVVKGKALDEFPSAVPLPMETHGGEDVAVFASGPLSHLFTGVYEQNTIPHLMAYASCIGSGLKSCDSSSS